MRFWIIFFLVYISFFGTVLGRFSQCNFKTFCRQPTMVGDIFTQSPTIKKLSTALLIPESFEKINVFDWRLKETTLIAKAVPDIFEIDDSKLL